MTTDVPMDAVSVGTRIADDWLEGTDENSISELCAAVLRLGERLGNTAEIIHGDEAVLWMAQAFRDAADDMEIAFGERVGHGERMMARLNARRAA